MADPTIGYAILAAIFAVILAALLYLQRKSVTGKEDGTQEAHQLLEGQQQQAGGNRPAANRINARARLRARLAERLGGEVQEDEVQAAEAAPGIRQAQPRHPRIEERDSDGSSGGSGEEDFSLPRDKKIGKKKAAKLQAKADKRAQRLIDEREREEKKTRDAEISEEKKKKEGEVEAAEAARLEQERLETEARERSEQEEYDLLKASFQVEEEGFDQAGDSEAEQHLLREFIQYIKSEKVVVLEELAARFRLKTQAVINRVTTLLENGTLTGVLDDRGKFIYISEAELQGIAKFIRQRGRVTITELAEASGTLISLTPDGDATQQQAVEA